MDGGLVSDVVIEIKNSNQRLVYGVGINDADYRVQIKEEMKKVNGKRVQRHVWRCPYYIKWVGMLERCYSEKYHAKGAYKGCTVSEEWKLFSNFKAWMETQDWGGLELDKDILVKGNKVYSSEKCVFVTQQVNGFITDSRKSRGEFPIGVYLDRDSGKFKSHCQNPFTGKQEHLGRFLCSHEAHKAWLTRKLEHAVALAAIQTDPRVAKALIDRYVNYKPTS